MPVTKLLHCGVEIERYLGICFKDGFYFVPVGVAVTVKFQLPFFWEDVFVIVDITILVKRGKKKDRKARIQRSDRYKSDKSYEGSQRPDL